MTVAGRGRDGDDDVAPDADDDDAEADRLTLPGTTATPESAAAAQRRRFRKLRRSARKNKKTRGGGGGVLHARRAVHHSAPGVRDLDGDATWKPPMPEEPRRDESFLPRQLRSTTGKSRLVDDRKQERLTGTWVDKGVQQRDTAHKQVREECHAVLARLNEDVKTVNDELPTVRRMLVLSVCALCA